ncbi:MAG: hypothetical protein Q9212_006831, partial [Teloschistes hypoglaucus]
MGARLLHNGQGHGQNSDDEGRLDNLDQGSSPRDTRYAPGASPGYEAQSLHLSQVHLGSVPIVPLSLTLPNLGITEVLRDLGFSECDRLQRQFPEITIVNISSQSLQYRYILQSYFNIPDALPADCFVQPRTTLEVSGIITVLSQGQCKFAIKGGGHMLPVGSNGIVDGVTVDLRQMRSTIMSVDNQTAYVQAGAKWGEVSNVLDPLGYALPGGRATDVGVAGLTLGGGNSFFTGRFGFTCDNVKNFEIILGNGTITNANAKHNPDLFKALKGGGAGNFGVVTRFDFATFELGLLWGGVAFYDFKDLHKMYKPFVEFTDNNVDSPKGSLHVVWQHNATSNEFTSINLYVYTGGSNITTDTYYTSPTSNSTTTNTTTAPSLFPSPFQNFSIPKLGFPYNASTLRIANLTDIAAEGDTPTGNRNKYGPSCFANNLTVLTEVNTIIARVLASVAADPPYEFATMEFQPLPRIYTTHSLAKGGNVMGLDRFASNNILFSFDATWTDAAKDEEVRRLSTWVLGNVTEYTQRVGAWRPWQYLNYAMEDQDP